MSHPAGECPSCKKPFKDGDDIVYCPFCGAPYHRHCYEKEGHCLFTAQHGPNFEYKPAGSASSETSKNSGGVLCKNCQTVNEASNIFCENCGTPLHNRAAEPNAGAAPPPYSPPPGAPTGGGPQPPFGSQSAPFGYNYFYAQTMQGEIEGISKQDWADYIGSSAPYYIQRMTVMERQRRKFSFIFSAFLFGPAYFAYRKMWSWAAATLVLSLVLMVPNFLWIAADAGTPLLPSLSMEMIDTLQTVASTLNMALSFFLGIFALNFFQKNGVKQINAIKAAHTGEDYRNQLARRGGISIPGLLIVIIVLVAFNILVNMVMGDALVAYIYRYFL